MILIINAGSSTIKYQLFKGEKVLVRDKVERIGTTGGPTNHHEATKILIEKLKQEKIETNKIKAVGHRVVHGGPLEKSSIINKEVIKIIEKYAPIAPLHNPCELEAIKAVHKQLPKAKNIAVFDTSYHHTMPEKAKTYAIPYQYYEKGIKRYGFHGTSHHYVANEAAKILNKKINKLNIITCHLGSGASITAIKKGKVIDTSMGFTPMEGLIMNTRGGDIDPGLIMHLAENMKLEQFNDLFNRKSGLQGICGKSDYRDVLEGKKKKEKKCTLAWEMFCYRVKKYIGAYTAALGKVDIIVFTAGGGENLPEMRKECLPLELLGIKIDDTENKKISPTKAKNDPKYKTEGTISKKNSKVIVMAIGTNEEKMIKEEVEKLL